MPDDETAAWSTHGPRSGYGSGPYPTGPYPTGPYATSPDATSPYAGAPYAGEPSVPPYAGGSSVLPYGTAAAWAGPPIETSGTPRSGPHLATVGVVLGGLALLGVLILGVVDAVTLGGGPDGPSRGTVTVSRGAVDGATLAAEVERQVKDDGGDPSGVRCPETARVSQDVTTVCHGQVDGDEWAFVVFFEDDRGSFTLLPV